MEFVGSWYQLVRSVNEAIASVAHVGNLWESTGDLVRANWPVLDGQHPVCSEWLHSLLSEQLQCGDADGGLRRGC